MKKVLSYLIWRIKELNLTNKELRSELLVKDLKKIGKIYLSYKGEEYHLTDISEENYYSKIVTTLWFSKKPNKKIDKKIILFAIDPDDTQVLVSLVDDYKIRRFNAIDHDGRDVIFVIDPSREEIEEEEDVQILSEFS